MESPVVSLRVSPRPPRRVDLADTVPVERVPPPTLGGVSRRPAIAFAVLGAAVEVRIAIDVASVPRCARDDRLAAPRAHRQAGVDLSTKSLPHLLVLPPILPTRHLFPPEEISLQPASRRTNLAQAPNRGGFPDSAGIRRRLLQKNRLRGDGWYERVTTRTAYPAARRVSSVPPSALPGRALRRRCGCGWRRRPGRGRCRPWRSGG